MACAGTESLNQPAAPDFSDGRSEAALEPPRPRFGEKNCQGSYHQTILDTHNVKSCTVN